MKTINIEECRQCSVKILTEEKQLIIKPREEVEFIIKVVSKCQVCKISEPRSSGGGKIPFRGV